MRRPLVALSTVPGLLLAVLLSGCTGGDAGPDADGVVAAADAAPAVAQAADQEVAAPAAAEDADPGDAEAAELEAEVVDPEDDGASIDVSIPPDPDPTADAADYGDFGWAFERGRAEGLYGRTDYYEPRGVGDPGSMAGLRAQQSYRAGFALGLAQADGREQERAGARESAAAEAAAAEADGPVGQVLAGWDAYSAASTYWELDDPLSCSEAGPEDPCLDTWYTVGNRSIVAVARLDATVGPGPRHALELRADVLGYEVLQVWDADEDADEAEASLPAWARDA